MVNVQNHSTHKVSFLNSNWRNIPILLCGSILLDCQKEFTQFFGRILMRLIILVCWAGTISLRALCPKIPRKRALAPFLVVSSHTISKFSSFRCILHLSCDHLTSRHHCTEYSTQVKYSRNWCWQFCALIKFHPRCSDFWELWLGIKTFATWPAFPPPQRFLYFGKWGHLCV